MSLYIVNSEKFNNLSSPEKLFEIPGLIIYNFHVKVWIHLRNGFFLVFAFAFALFTVLKLKLHVWDQGFFVGSCVLV